MFAARILFATSSASIHMAWANQEFFLWLVGAKFIPIDALRASFGQSIIGRSYVIISRPSQTLLHRETTTMPPTFFNRSATTRMVHAGVQFAGTLATGHRNWNSQC